MSLLGRLIFTRANLQDHLMRIQEKIKNTVVVITHDVDEAVLLSDRIVMMTNGPAATIGEIVEVNLPKPRNRLEVQDNPEYHRCKEVVLDFLYKKFGKRRRIKYQSFCKADFTYVSRLIFGRQSIHLFRIPQ